MNNSPLQRSMFSDILYSSIDLLFKTIYQPVFLNKAEVMAKLIDAETIEKTKPVGVPQVYNISVLEEIWGIIIGLGSLVPQWVRVAIREHQRQDNTRTLLIVGKSFADNVVSSIALQLAADKFRRSGGSQTDPRILIRKSIESFSDNLSRLLNEGIQNRGNEQSKRVNEVLNILKAEDKTYEEIIKTIDEIEDAAYRSLVYNILNDYLNTLQNTENRYANLINLAPDNIPTPEDIYAGASIFKATTTARTNWALKAQSKLYTPVGQFDFSSFKFPDPVDLKEEFVTVCQINELCTALCKSILKTTTIKFLFPYMDTPLKEDLLFVPLNQIEDTFRSSAAKTVVIESSEHTPSVAFTNSVFGDYSRSENKMILKITKDTSSSDPNNPVPEPSLDKTLSDILEKIRTILTSKDKDKDKKIASLVDETSRISESVTKIAEESKLASIKQEVKINVEENKDDNKGVEKDKAKEKEKKSEDGQSESK